jgi:hypothetical protein
MKKGKLEIKMAKFFLKKFFFEIYLNQIRFPNFIYFWHRWTKDRGV